MGAFFTIETYIVELFLSRAVQLAQNLTLHSSCHKCLLGLSQAELCGRPEPSVLQPHSLSMRLPFHSVPGAMYLPAICGVIMWSAESVEKRQVGRGWVRALWCPVVPSLGTGLSETAVLGMGCGRLARSWCPSGRSCPVLGAVCLVCVVCCSSAVARASICLHTK